MEPDVPRRAAPLIRLVGFEQRLPADAAATRGPHCSPGVAAAVAAIVGTGAGLDDAWSAPGDLDPSFGDVGRFADFGQATTLRSIDVREDESIFLAGGVEYSYYCYYYGNCDLVDTLGALTAFGLRDSSFVPPDLADTVIFDAALQSDGKMVATGRADLAGLLVLRLMPGGALDASFGTAGQAFVANPTDVETGHSILVQADGRIVVAGSSSGRLMVVRLLSNGTLDDTFASAGVFRSTTHLAVSTSVRIASVPGGYRVTADGPAPAVGCEILALTLNGAVDTTFGGDGSLLAPGTAGDEITCTSLAVLADGRMLLGGSRNSGAPYLAQALPNGSVDPTFHGESALGSLDAVSAVAVSPVTGRIFVAGADPTGLSGATIVRLLADGTVDSLFGIGGATVVDLERPYWGRTRILDMQVRGGDALVVAGDVFVSPFVARLLGDGDIGGPGVLGMARSSVEGTEAAGAASVKVRRTGGSTGAITVSYSTRSNFEPGPRPNQDYTPVTGTLSWPDGDYGEREIVVPILANNLAEDQEQFEVLLEDPDGGAGLGALTTTVIIPPDVYPAGRFALLATLPLVREGSETTLRVSRENYSAGAVSVTLRVAGGTAMAGQDFNPGWTDVTLNWADGELSTKTVTLQFVQDHTREPEETIGFELVSPTGGALLGESTQTTVTVADARRPDAGGGGHTGVLGTALLGLLAWWRRLRSGAALTH